MRVAATASMISDSAPAYGSPSFSRSASIPGRAALEVRGHPAGVHAQPGEQLGGLRRGHDRAPGERAQRGPLDVPRAVGAFVELAGGGGVQGRRKPGRGQCGAADQHREDGVPLLRHRRGAAALSASDSSPISGREPVQDVVGDVAPGVGAAGQGVAEPGDGRTAGVPGRCDLEVRAPRRRPRRGRASGRVADRPGCRPRRRSGSGSGPASAIAASSTPPSQLATVRPKVIGTACWVRVRPACGVARCSAASRVSAKTWALTSARIRADRLARAEHQRRVDDVLTGESAVQLPCRGGVAEPLAQQGQQRDHRVAAGLGPPRDGRGVVRLQQLLQVGGDALGGEPRRLDAGHRGQHRVVGEQATGALVAGPEQVGHDSPGDVWPGKVRNTVSSSPCRRTSNTSPCASGVANSVARRSGSSPERNGSDGVRRQVDAGEQPMRQAAGEHRHGEEREPAGLGRAGPQRGERVVPPGVGRRPPPAGERPAVAPERAAPLHHVPVRVGLPDLQQRVRHRVAVPVVDVAVQPDRARETRRHQVGAAVEGQGVAEERPDGLAGVASWPPSSGVRWPPVSTMSQR